VFAFYYSSQFKKDLKRLKRRSKRNFAILEKFVDDLGNKGFKGVPEKFKPHSLIGNYRDCYECHVKNDLLLIWKEDLENNSLTLIRAGTHSDLFSK
jgi:mRNA interferase YafQ